MSAQGINKTPFSLLLLPHGSQTGMSGAEDGAPPYHAQPQDRVGMGGGPPSGVPQLEELRTKYLNPFNGG